MPALDFKRKPEGDMINIIECIHALIPDSEDAEIVEEQCNIVTKMVRLERQAHVGLWSSHTVSSNSLHLDRASLVRLVLF